MLLLVCFPGWTKQSMDNEQRERGILLLFDWPVAPIVTPCGGGTRTGVPFLSLFFSTPLPPGGNRGARPQRPAAGARGAAAKGGNGNNQQGIMRFYTDDAPGLRIGPTVVLVFSLAFIGCVVLLHIWGKFKG
ncbi:unnamed protein product [Pylaiella littoralis]